MSVRDIWSECLTQAERVSMLRLLKCRPFASITDGIDAVIGDYDAAQAVCDVDLTLVLAR